MSIYSAMRTSTSGMAGQASRLGAVADNVANVTTAGYKRAEVNFSSFLIDPGPSTYTSGGIETNVRRQISLQGSLRTTQSPTDIAIAGRGFLVVADSEGASAITRAGSFVTDGQGRLVNTAGYYLQGFPVQNGVIPTAVAAGFTGLETVVVDYVKLEPLSVPVIRDGALAGYVITRIVYAIDTATQKKLGVAPDPFIADEAFRTVYSSAPVNVRQPEEYDLEALAATIRKNVNARLKGEAVREVLIQSFDWVQKR